MGNKEFIKNAIRTESPNFFPVNPRVLHASIGLVTESAELADALKKTMFYGKELDITNVKEEAGDILWYLAILFDAIGTDFETEMDRVIAKLQVRFPEKFTNEFAEERDLDKEREVLEGYARPVPSSAVQCKLCKGPCNAWNPNADENCPDYVPF